MKREKKQTVMNQQLNKNKIILIRIRQECRKETERERERKAGKRRKIRG